MIHILTGTNWFGVKQRLDELRTEFIENNDELGVENIDGEDVTFQQIKSAQESLPFLSTQKMLIITRLAKNKAAIERIEELVYDSSDDVVTIFVEPEIDKRSVYYKTLKKLKGFEEFSEFDEQEAAKWLVRQAEKRDGELSISDANYVVSMAGNNQQKLAGEIDKLLAYSQKITRENIKLLVEPTAQSSVFSLLDAFFRGDLNLALKLYDDQRAQGTEPLNILGMLAWQLHAIALVQAYKGSDINQISQRSGVKPFVLQKSRSVADRIDKERLQKLLDDLLSLDIKFKTTSIDQDNALKNAITNFSRA
jgi:DNA polymerase III subunit delta